MILVKFFLYLLCFLFVINTVTGTPKLNLKKEPQVQETAQIPTEEPKIRPSYEEFDDGSLELSANNFTEEKWELDVDRLINDYPDDDVDGIFNLYKYPYGSLTFDKRLYDDEDTGLYFRISIGGTSSGSGEWKIENGKLDISKYSVSISDEESKDQVSPFELFVAENGRPGLIVTYGKYKCYYIQKEIIRTEAGDKHFYMSQDCLDTYLSYIENGNAYADQTANFPYSFIQEQDLHFSLCGMMDGEPMLLVTSGDIENYHSANQLILYGYLDNQIVTFNRVYMNDESQLSMKQFLMFNIITVSNEQGYFSIFQKEVSEYREAYSRIIIEIDSKGRKLKTDVVESCEGEYEHVVDNKANIGEKPISINWFHKSQTKEAREYYSRYVKQ